MMTITIDDAAARQMLGIDLAPLVPVIGVAIAEDVRNVIAPYPPARPQRQPFVSARQRRAFFAKLRSGAISVPYRRQGVIGRSWLITPHSAGATLDNNARGVPYVHVAATQARYHQGNWKTEVEAAQIVEAQGRPQRIAERIIADALEKGS